MGVEAIEALFCISHFASCLQLPFAHQVTLLLLLPLKGLFVCVSWRPVCLAHVKMPGGPGQGGLAQVWAAVHPQHLAVGGRCSSVSMGPCSRSSSTIWFSMAFYPSFPHTGPAFGSHPQHPPKKNHSPLALTPPSLPSCCDGAGIPAAAGHQPGAQRFGWKRACAHPSLPCCTGQLVLRPHSPQVFSETKGPFLGTVPWHSSEGLASLMALRASSQGLFMTLRLLGVVK